MEKSDKTVTVEWYLPDPGGLDPLGPFSFEEISGKIVSGEVPMTTHAWGTHFSTEKWIRLLEIPEFGKFLDAYPKCPLPKRRGRGSSQKTVAKLDFSKSEGEYGVENEYRRFPRAPMKCGIIVHNQHSYLKCESVDISEKGVFVRTENNLQFPLGEEVIVTLLDTSYAGTFSVRATVMRSLDRPFRGYGLYFLTINPMIKRRMAQYIIETLGRAPRESGAA